MPCMYGNMYVSPDRKNFCKLHGFKLTCKISPLTFAIYLTYISTYKVYIFIYIRTCIPMVVLCRLYQECIVQAIRESIQLFICHIQSHCDSVKLNLLILVYTCIKLTLP